MNFYSIDGVAWYPDESSMVCEKHFMNKFKSDDSDSPSYNPTLCLNVINFFICFKLSIIFTN